MENLSIVEEKNSNEEMIRKIKETECNDHLFIFGEKAKVISGFYIGQSVIIDDISEIVPINDEELITKYKCLVEVKDIKGETQHLLRIIKAIDLQPL